MEMKIPIPDEVANSMLMMHVEAELESFLKFKEEMFGIPAYVSAPVILRFRQDEAMNKRSEVPSLKRRAARYSDGGGRFFKTDFIKGIEGYTETKDDEAMRLAVATGLKEVYSEHDFPWIKAIEIPCCTKKHEIFDSRWISEIEIKDEPEEKLLDSSWISKIEV